MFQQYLKSIAKRITQKLTIMGLFARIPVLQQEKNIKPVMILPVGTANITVLTLFNPKMFATTEKNRISTQHTKYILKQDPKYLGIKA